MCCAQASFMTREGARLTLPATVVPSWPLNEASPPPHKKAKQVVVALIKDPSSAASTSSQAAGRPATVSPAVAAPSALRFSTPSGFTTPVMVAVPPAVRDPTANVSVATTTIQQETINKLMSLYNGSVGHARSSCCTVCSRLGQTGTGEAMYVPAALLGDVPILMNQPMFRQMPNHEVSMYQGYQLCNTHKSQHNTGVVVMTLGGATKQCLLCHDKGISGEGLCSTCARDNNKQDIVKTLFVLLPAIFPFKDIQLMNQATFEPVGGGSSRRSADYWFSAMMSDGKRVLFIVEMDENMHQTYDLKDEKRRMASMMAHFLNRGYEKVVFLRHNYKEVGAGSAPPGISWLPPTHLRHVILRTWVIYLLHHIEDLPKTTILYLFYPFHQAYEDKMRAATATATAEWTFMDEDDIDDTLMAEASRRLVPFWRNQFTGFAYAPPQPPSQQDKTIMKWFYYLSSAEWRRCFKDGSVSKTYTSHMVGELQEAFSRPDMGWYRVFVNGLRSTQEMLPSVRVQMDILQMSAANRGVR